MINVTARLIATLVAILDGAALLALGTYAAVTQRLTERETLAGFALLIVAAVAAFWLRRDRLHGGRS